MECNAKMYALADLNRRPDLRYLLNKSLNKEVALLFQIASVGFTEYVRQKETPSNASNFLSSSDDITSREPLTPLDTYT